MTDPATILRAAALCALLAARGVDAQPEPAAAPALGPALEAVATRALAEPDVVGGAVVVLRDGRVEAKHAYGVADVATRRPVDADATLFRVTSVTKALTAAAVVRAAEAGRVDLAADVRDTLDFALDGPAAPVTLHQLLTHTAGFEERSRDFHAPPGGTLADYVRTHAPPLVYPPGETVSYSNYGYALAARVVEIAVGEPFETFVAREFLDRIDVGPTALATPYGDATLAALAGEYRSAGSAAEPLRYLPDVPAGGLVIGVHGLARLMHALYFPDGVARLLAPGSVELLHAAQFRGHPAVDGVGYGMREATVAGTRTLYQGGDSCCHHTDVYVVPALRVVYVHAYSGANRRLRSDMWRATSTALLPAPPDVARAGGPLPADAPRGRFTLTRRAERSILSLLYVFSNQVDVVHADGALAVPAVFRAADGAPRRFAPVADGVYADPTDGRTIAFRQTSRGTTLAGGGLVEAHATPWHRDARVVVVVLAGSVLLALLGLLSGTVRRALRALPLVAVGMTGFVVTYFGFALAARDDLSLLAAEHDWVLRVAQAFAALHVVGALATLAGAVTAWRTLGTGARAFAALAALFALAAAWVLVDCNVFAVAMRY